jgi:hypothetical protein
MTPATGKMPAIGKTPEKEKGAINSQDAERRRQGKKQCCGSGNLCFFDPWIRDEKNPEPE